MDVYKVIHRVFSFLKFDKNFNFYFVVLSFNIWDLYMLKTDN